MTTHTNAGALAEECATHSQPVEPEMLLDDMTPMQFALTELHKFQEATGCDTADQLNAQPVEQFIKEVK
jgi:hypothetical protein